MLTQTMHLNMQAQRAAFAAYLRRGTVPPPLIKLIDVTHALGVFLKANPDWQSQPRVPAGDPNGGQWTNGGGNGGGVGGSRSRNADNLQERIDTYAEQNIYDPPLERVYLAEILIGGLSKYATSELFFALKIIFKLGFRNISENKYSKLEKELEEYFGGIPKAKTNKAGDIIIMRDNKKIRFDINNHVPDEKPHYHVEIYVKAPGAKKGTWVDVGAHRYYFNSGD